MSYFLIILIPPIITLSNLYYLFFNFGYWKTLLEKSGVYQTFTKEEADQKAQSVLEFYEKKNVLDDKFFSKQAALHLTDVKRSLYLSIVYFILSLLASLVVIAVLFIKRKTKLFLRSIAVASGITAVLTSALALGLSKAFDSFFLIFHKTIFTNNLWMFPTTDELVKLFPAQFFVYFANRLALQIILTSLLISITAFIIRKRLYDSA